VVERKRKRKRRKTPTLAGAVGRLAIGPRSART
jgi:hypothetical protein